MHGDLLSVRETLCCLATPWMFFQAHLPVRLPCYDLPPLEGAYYLLVIIDVRSGEGDGRCVRASGPVSGGHSTPYLLLNPPWGSVISIGPT